MPYMNARKSGLCRVCGEVIGVGDRIFWRPREGARHEDCDGRKQSKGRCEDAPCCGCCDVPGMRTQEQERELYEEAREWGMLHLLR